MKKHYIAALLGLVVLASPLLTLAASNANTTAAKYSDPFGYGINLGYNGPYYEDEQLANLARGLPGGTPSGFGMNTIRVGLFEKFTQQWGIGIRKSVFDHYKTIGLRNVTAIIADPSDINRDPIDYCADDTTNNESFKNLYEPIWDNNNGTPINENNPYATYVYNLAKTYHGDIRFFEVNNEPDVVYSGDPTTWFNVAPPPCQTKFHAPIYNYIRMLHITYDVLKSVDKNNLVCLGGIGNESYLDVILRYSDNPVDGSVTTQYPLQGGAYFDCLDYHKYPHYELKTWRADNTGFDMNRHSDAANDALWRFHQTLIARLQKYGYGTKFPSKVVNISEFNIPRVGRTVPGTYSVSYIGSSEAQRNFIIKALIDGQRYGVAQMDPYSLSDESGNPSTSEFKTMGFVDNLDGIKPYTYTAHDEAWAFKTTSQLLGGLKYSAARTALLHLPATIRGAAFVSPTGKYTYVLWAKTTQDNTEAASASYTFPTSLLPSSAKLAEYAWDYSKNPTAKIVSVKNITLTGSPIFLSSK